MLKKQIQSDSLSALKSPDHLSAEVLRMVLAAVILKEKEKRYKLSKEGIIAEEEEIAKKSELTDEEVIGTLSSEIKKRRDAISFYEKGGRQELAEKEKREIGILQKYLPEQLSKEELLAIIKESIVKVGASSMKDMGKIMADLMPKIKGRADSSEVSKIIKSLLE